MGLTKEQILSAADMLAEDVPVPEWSGTVLVRVMRGTDRDSLAAAIHKASADGAAVFNYKMSLLQRTIVDDAGEPLFDDEGIAQLHAKSAPVLDRLYAVADRLNAVGAKAVDAAEKN